VGIVSSFNCNITTISNSSSNGTYGMYFSACADNRINALTTTGNTSGAIGTTTGGYNYIQTATLAEGNKVVPTADYTTQTVFIQSLASFAYVETLYANVVSQNATAGGSGIEWKISITNVLRSSSFPLKYRVAEFAALTTAQVTITLYFKKSSTDIAASFVLPGGQIGGPVADTVTPCPDDANRNQLQIQFNPTAAGVFYVEAWAWWAANLADESVIIDDISITQA
jgi:hypothetical protein